MPVPADVIAALEAATAAQENAKAKDAELVTKEDAVKIASVDRDAAYDASLSAHQASLVASEAAIAKVKQYLGVM